MLEGLAIAADGVGAREIYIYIRGEFGDERRSLERALAEARELRWRTSMARRRTATAPTSAARRRRCSSRSRASAACRG